MSNVILINASCVEQNVDAIVNAANRNLLSGGGVCAAIFAKTGYVELTEACRKYRVPLRDGEAVIIPAFNIKNAKYIIHAVGPDFAHVPDGFDKLFDAYYNSLKVLMETDLHSIAFPLISSGIFGGSIENPPAVSSAQCIKAYRKFISDFSEYNVDVVLYAYGEAEFEKAKMGIDNNIIEI